MTNDAKVWQMAAAARALAGIAIAVGAAGCACAQRTATPDASRCATLVGGQVEAGRVVSAEHVAQGQALGSMLSAKAAVSFCRALVRLQPAPGSDIQAELWLPDAWNGKLLTHGGGGFSGGLGYSTAAMSRSIDRGYATATSDLGHAVSATARWAHRQPERVIDFGHRANHLVAVAAKQVSNAYYRGPVQRAYFQGCSGGGREALMEVLRYPEDYDGVIAGAPALAYTEIMTQMLWNARTMAAAPRLPSKLSSVSKSVLEACDGLDGMRDGVIANPMQCRFDPAVLQCRVFDTGACLTPTEMSVLRALYEGPRLPGGERLIAGPALGSEGPGWVLAQLMTSIGGPEFYRWLVHDDPTWREADFDLERDHRLARSRIAPLVNADDPHIAAFARRGGKLIMYHGWNDTLISPYSSIGYVDSVRRTLGPMTDDSVRLFMVPGMQHCAEGIDLLPQLEAWVERQRAPDRARATLERKRFVGSTSHSQLLCPWPQMARPVGTAPTALDCR